MKKYWIILDGQPRGPFTPQEIAGMGVASPTLRVWHKGLPEWEVLSNVPELAAILPQADGDNAAPAEETEAVEITEITAAESQPSGSSTEAPRLQTASWGAAQPSATMAASTRRPAPGARMPATYLPWNILATICCCLPAGIAGIIFSSRVSKKFYEGDMAGARRASEAAAWCLMLSIVLGLVCWPFQMLFSGV